MAVQASLVADTPSVARPKRRRNMLPYYLALPVLLYEGIFIFLPIIQEIGSSFTSDVIGAGDVKWVVLKNFERLLYKDPAFWVSLRVTLIYMLFVIILAVGAGLLTGMLMNQSFRLRGLARSAITLPWAFPDVPTALIFLWILNPSFGVINVVARLVPTVTQNPKWLLDFNLAMPIVIAISSWKAFPFYGLAILAALQAIPSELKEAAKVDGANNLQAFWYVTLPGIAPTMALMAVLAAIFSFKQFSLIFLTTGGGPARITETLVVKMFNTAFRQFDFSYGATIGVAGFIVALIFTIVFTFVQGRQTED
jgi:multiple sugar transport system permease protein